MLTIALIHEVFHSVQLACGPHLCESHLTVRPFAQHWLGPAIHFCNRVWQQRCAWGCDRWRLTSAPQQQQHRAHDKKAPAPQQGDDV
jgi:hypothetical protein